MIRKLIGILVLTSPVLAFGQFESTVAPELQPTRIVEPRLPSEMRGKGGEVKVLLKIDSEGRVSDLVVQDSSDEEHARSVVNAVRQWRFAPSGGEEVERKVLLPVRFVAANN